MNEELELRAEVAAFAQAMERQLRKNDHKGGWKQCTNEYIDERLEQELDEVYAVLEEIATVEKHPGNEPEAVRAELDKELLGELVDVANFLMMKADIAGLLV